MSAGGGKVPAATVLFEPEPALFAALCQNLDHDGRRLYVFVNGPVDAETEARMARLADGVVIRSQVNVGLAAALNAVADRAAADGFSHLLLLDQDSTPAPDLPEVLRARMDGDERLAVVAPLLVPPAGSGYLPIRYAWKRGDEVYFAPTSGSLISLAAWAAVGPFRADYFVGGIDVEWGFRAGSRGFRSVVLRDVQLEHRWGTPAAERGTPQILRHSDLRLHYYIRNAIDLLRQPYVPLGWKAKYALTLCAQIALLLQKRGYSKEVRRLVVKAARDGWTGQLGPEA